MLETDKNSSDWLEEIYVYKQFQRENKRPPSPKNPPNSSEEKEGWF